MKCILALTALLVSTALAAPAESPADAAIAEVQTGEQVQAMPEPDELMAVRACMRINRDDDFDADYSHQAEGKAVFNHLPTRCCELLKKAVKKHGWFPEFGHIHFGGSTSSDGCNLVRLTDVPRNKFKALKKLTGTN